MPSLRVTLASAILLAGSAHAETCAAVAALGGIDVSFPLAVEYDLEQTKYWSTTCQALLPSCIIFPTSAEQVSDIIKALNDNTEPFAIKSGGHNPNSYFSSVSGGPVISTQKLDQAILDPATGIVDVGPGNRLDSIAAKLQGSGWTFVGGRIGNTGVGGLVLGGGLSYMSTQYGWAASSVLEYTLVVANGTIVKVNRDNHLDLFTSLKGGGNNFGVVTNYRLQARRQGNVVGGNLVFLRTPSVDHQLLKAVRDFTEHNEDEKAAIIVTAERANLNLIDSWIIFLFYDGPVVPPGTFTAFTNGANIPILNTVRERTYADLMAFSNWVVVKGSVVDIGTETIPNASEENFEETIEAIHAFWRNMSSTVLDVPGIVASIAWQPFQKKIAQQARLRGPDLFDADDSIDRIILEINFSFIPHIEYERMADTMEATYSGIHERVLSWQDEGKMPQGYLPLFMNYGFFREDYWGRLRPASRALAHSVSLNVDPEGFFRTRTGGWKP